MFRRDAAAPEANGRPHWNTAEGGWYLDEFTPDELGCHANFATAGEVPVGETAWGYVHYSLEDTDRTMGSLSSGRWQWPICDGGQVVRDFHRATHCGLKVVKGDDKRRRFLILWETLY